MEMRRIALYFPVMKFYTGGGKDANWMSNLNSILTLNQSAEKTIAWTMQRLLACGFQVEQTFDLHAARMSQEDCRCPHHGTTNCSCQMIVLLVHGQETQPRTIVVHGHDGETCISLLDVAGHSNEERIIQVLLPVLEDSEI